MAHDRRPLSIRIARQPDDRSCGPTCLQAVYKHFGDERSLDDLVASIPQLPSGGTLAVQLGCHALRSGYDCSLVTYNLQLFDPTWFSPEVDLVARLRAQAERKPDDGRLHAATDKYLDYLQLGGTVEHHELTPFLLDRYLAEGLPILTGLSATYLYGAARETPDDDRSDDVGGEPVGHFVVLSGSDVEKRTVVVADPMHDEGTGSLSTLPFARVKSSILLGVLTYDANLLIVRPRSQA